MSSDTFPPTFNQSKDEGGLNRSMDQVRRPSLDFHVDYFFYVEDLDAARQSWTDDRAFYPSTITYGLTFVLGLIGNTFVIVLGLIGNTPGLIGNTLGLTFVLGLIGNTLVLVALLGDRKSPRNVTTILMVSLAISDFLFLLVCVPYDMANMFISYWSTGVTMCKLVGYVEMLSALASVLNLTAVSVERYRLHFHH